MYRSDKAVYDYLRSRNYTEASAAFKAECGLGDDPPDPRLEGLLEKKWVAVIRLQKKVCSAVPLRFLLNFCAVRALSPYVEYFIMELNSLRPLLSLVRTFLHRFSLHWALDTMQYFFRGHIDPGTRDENGHAARRTQVGTSVQER